MLASNLEKKVRNLNFSLNEGSMMIQMSLQNWFQMRFVLAETTTF